MRLIAAFLRDSEGTVAVEYAVMLVLVLMGVIAAVTSVGTSNGGMWTGIVAKLTGAGMD